MTIKTFTFNPFQENTYLIYDHTKEAVVVDAGCSNKSENEMLAHFILDNNLVLKRIINTHLHLDHQFGNKFLVDTYGIKPEACSDDEFLLDNVAAQARLFGIELENDVQELGGYISDNQAIKFGCSEMKAIHVPGHSPGSIAFYSEKYNFLIAGDVLFRGSIGRTDLLKGDYATLILSITKKLLILPEETVVYCGHGPTTTIGYEKENNPYL
jgi:glyoxylase-like metal-dependent hydrolase (beta-lactamase superfamily II)